MSNPISLMRILAFIIFGFLSLTSHADDDFYSLMLPGSYILVGKALDSEKTYVGKIVIEGVKSGFKITRVIAGKSVYGNGKIESAAGGDAKVLRIRFNEGGSDYEQTCMIGADLDNYARISCYLYRPGVETLNPGLEVLFIDHTTR